MRIARLDQFLLGEEAIPDDSPLLAPIEERLGNCYEFSALWMLNQVLHSKNSDAVREAISLVHGTIQGFGHPRIDHAWVCINMHEREFCFDPVSRLCGERPGWDAYHNARWERRFSFDQARAHIIGFGHYGPWPDIREVVA